MMVAEVLAIPARADFDMETTGQRKAALLSEHRNLFLLWQFCERTRGNSRERPMHGLIYLIGLIVVIVAILSFFGLR
jgi:hypothetical protein